jgi:hypothetical protein
MMAVGSEMEATGICGEEPLEQVLEAHASSNLNRMALSTSGGRAGREERRIMNVDSWNRSRKTRLRSAERVK